MRCVCVSAPYISGALHCTSSSDAHRAYIYSNARLWGEHTHTQATRPVFEEPFASAVKLASFRYSNGRTYLRGAPDVLLEACDGRSERGPGRCVCVCV